MEKEYSEGNILLRPLSIKDAKGFYQLYASQNNETCNQAAETPIEFTERILSASDCIFTIRTIENSLEIIGDCALHHWNKEKSEIEIGGTLLSAYWGKGIMATAFQILIDIAKQKYFVSRLIAKTEITNSKALKFARKFGFRKIGITNQTVILKKIIKPNC